MRQRPRAARRDLATDRDATLRRAEKLLRQGRLDGAIEEYRRLLEEQPGDWGTANLLGDLYVRAGQLQSAAEQFSRVADHYAAEGFLPKANALYRKVLKIVPDNEHALLQSAEIAGRQGLLADARASLSMVAEMRRKRGDARGAAEVLIRLAALDPGDPALALQAARAMAALGHKSAAAARFRDAASALDARGQAADCLAVLLEALEIEPHDDETRSKVVEALIRAGDLDAARGHARNAAHFKAVSAALADAGREEEARTALAEALRLDPQDEETRARLLAILVRRGLWDQVREALPADPAASAETALVGLEAELLTGNVPEACLLAEKAIACGTLSEVSVSSMVSRLAPADPCAAWALVELLTGRAVGESDWNRAADILRKFIGLVPGHVPALSRLVEVSVDGGLEESLSEAQADLADAHLAAGHAAEARVIAEDLVTRQPWNKGHIERLRRILATLGEKDPDQVIADRLSAESLLVDPIGEFREATVDEPRRTEASQPDAPVQDARPGEPLEVDLSDAFSAPAVGPAPSRQPEVPPAEVGSLESAFDDFRQEVIRDRTTDAAAQYFKLATMYHGNGLLEQAIEALQLAARAPRYRFEAAALAGRINRQLGRLGEAIEWFERAAEAPAATPMAAHELLYDLGTALEEAGEADRSLAVFLELETDAGAFRDVGARIARLRAR
ncbi:MAG: tetratricopeptide repeat protein [Vicinamibacterales bacterium]